MKKILVTGAGGYIGQHLCRLLLDNLDIDLHRLDIGYKKYSDVMQVTNPFFPVDIKTLCKSAVFSDIEYDTIIHLAALVQVGESVKIPYEYYDTNVNGTANLLKNVKHKQFIFASTGAAESPDSPYGMSKRIAEDVVRQYSGNKSTIFRFYNVIGTDGFPPTNPDGLFFNLIKATKTGQFNLYGTDYATKDGTAIREYVHVNDICRAIIKSLDKPSEDVHNLAYGDPRTVLEIINMFKETNNVDFEVIGLPRRSGDLESMYLTSPSEHMERNYTYEQLLKC